MASDDDNIEKSVFEILKPVLDAAKNMSEADKTFVLTSMWTQDQLAEITSEKQYELYSRLQDELHARAQLPDKGDPGYDKAWLEFARSPQGILATSYGARMIEWEERQAVR